MASERKDAVEIRGCCSVACCPSAPQAEAMSCFKTEEVLRCWRELVHEKCGEGGGTLLRSVVAKQFLNRQFTYVTTEKVPTEPTASRQVRAARSLEVRGTVARAAPSARAGGEARPLVRQAAVCTMVRPWCSKTTVYTLSRDVRHVLEMPRSTTGRIRPALVEGLP